MGTADSIFLASLSLQKSNPFYLIVLNCAAPAPRTTNKSNMNNFAKIMYVHSRVDNFPDFLNFRENGKTGKR